MRISDWSSDVCSSDLPSEEHDSGRPCRRSPLYSVLKQQGACFGEKLGWERPNWYADGGRGEAAEDRYSFGRPNWFEAVGREHRAAREAAVLFDQSSEARRVGKGGCVRGENGCWRYH